MKNFLVIFVIGISVIFVAGEDFCANQKDGALRPHETDCAQFYICQNKISVVKNCAPGQHYNAEKRYCQLPELAGCDKSIITTTTDGGSITTPSKPPPTPPTTPTKPTGKPDPTSCRNQPLGKHIPFVGDCTQYIVCIGGGVVMSCPASGITHFNARLEVCDWPESANCPWSLI